MSPLACECNITGDHTLTIKLYHPVSGQVDLVVSGLNVTMLQTPESVAALTGERLGVPPERGSCSRAVHRCRAPAGGGSHRILHIPHVYPVAREHDAPGLVRVVLDLNE